MTKASSACLTLARAVEQALGALTKPQAAYEKARIDRDACLPTWTKALSRLRKHADAAWDDERATYRVLFASPLAVQAATRAPAPGKKAKAKKAPAGSVNGAAQKPPIAVAPAATPTP